MKLMQHQNRAQSIWEMSTSGDIKNSSGQGLEHTALSLK